MQTIQLISLRHSAFYTPYLITFVGDFLAQQGLKAEYRCVGSVDALESALLCGEAHVAQSAVAVTMRQHDTQPDTDKTIQHFAQINQRDGFFIAASVDNSQSEVSADWSQFDWRSLENKRIIADHLFQPIATLKYVLTKNAVDIDKVEFIDSGDVKQSMAAFVSGKADFIHLQGPYPQQLVAEGNACIVASVGAALGNIAYSSLCATSNWLATPVAVKFIQAYKAAVEYVQQTDGKKLAEQLSSQFDSVQLDTLQETIMAYKKLASWSQDICISERAFNTANDVFIFSGDITGRVEYSEVVTDKLCRMV